MKTVNPLPQLYRQRDDIVRRARKQFAGGLSYGLDCPTWANVDPVGYAEWCGKSHLIAKETRILFTTGLHPSQTR